MILHEWNKSFGSKKKECTFYINYIHNHKHKLSMENGKLANIATNARYFSFERGLHWMHTQFHTIWYIIMETERASFFRPFLFFAVPFFLRILMVRMVQHLPEIISNYLQHMLEAHLFQSSLWYSVLVQQTEVDSVL